MRAPPFALSVYAAATRAAAPFARPYLGWRVRRGKEDAERYEEKLGRPTIERPDGKLVWMHGASVGETLSLLPLVDRFRASAFHVLVTSGTVTSAALMLRRLPAGAAHQFAPLDAPAFAARFLDHWRPDLALFAESEIWPNLLAATAAAGAPIALVNARLSERSYQRWRRAPVVIETILRQFELVAAQSDADAFRFGALGAPRVVAPGNLKFDGPAPPADSMKLAAMSAAVAGRPLWLAASTHEGEDEAILAAHRLMLARLPDLLTIIAPRHPERGAEIAEIAAMDGFKATLRSRGGLPAPDTAIYVADTIGELGLFYRLSPVAFMGGSLISHGGQNPIEPAKLAVAILHGPHVVNFSDTYAALDRDAGARLVADAETIAREILALIGDPAAVRAMGRRAHATVSTLAGATERTFQELRVQLAGQLPELR
jgi:3-deoxy-D-manno-octulosonic-acid transferase